jgi:hypothetical protein
MSVVNSYNCEFGYELISVIPYAYYLHLQGLLTETISAKGSNPFYYFSPKHTINPQPRSWYYKDSTAVEYLIKDNVPNVLIHKPSLDLNRWIPPPYKKYYKTDIKTPKPLYIVFNRYNNEYPATFNKPINFFSLELLKEVFTILKKNYEVIYVNIEGHKSLYDNATPLHLEDLKLCREMGIKHINDLCREYKGLSFNQVLLFYFGSCEHYLTMNGGGSILASYFGGRNLIYSKQSKELISGDFGYYHLFGGSEIKVVTTYADILTNL